MFLPHMKLAISRRVRRGNSSAPWDHCCVKAFDSACVYAQDMKPCVEFSADVSRGDGLRGWCKVRIWHALHGGRQRVVRCITVLLSPQALHVCT